MSTLSESSAAPKPPNSLGTLSKAPVEPTEPTMPQQEPAQAPTTAADNHPPSGQPTSAPSSDQRSGATPGPSTSPSQDPSTRPTPRHATYAALLASLYDSPSYLPSSYDPSSSILNSTGGLPGGSPFLSDLLGSSYGLLGSELGLSGGALGLPDLPSTSTRQPRARGSRQTRNSRRAAYLAKIEAESDQMFREALEASASSTRRRDQSRHYDPVLEVPRLRTPRQAQAPDPLRQQEDGLLVSELMTAYTIHEINNEHPIPSAAFQPLIDRFLQDSTPIDELDRLYESLHGRPFADFAAVLFEELGLRLLDESREEDVDRFVERLALAGERNRHRPAGRREE